jgi:methionyl aminopeptidase
MAERLLRRGAVPAFMDTRGTRDVVRVDQRGGRARHSVPTRALRSGDIISLDMGARIDGFYGDSAVTVAVGPVPERTATLLRVTRESLERAIAQVRVGARLSDVGHAVQTWVEQHGFSVVREFVGHGIGEKLHEDPQIPNYGTPGRGPRLAAGMVLAIEPMVAMGRPETRVLGDGWTAVTKDGSLAAHFEHTVAVTAEGPRVLTARAGDPVGAAARAH